MQSGVRDKTKILYNTSLGVIFGVKKYADSLMPVVKRKYWKSSRFSTSINFTWIAQVNKMIDYQMVFLTFFVVNIITRLFLSMCFQGH